MNKEDVNDSNPRIDKWLWAVRVCKTRTQASDLCERGKVRIDGALVKASHKVKEGQLVTVKQAGVAYQFKVIRCIDKRVGAPIASECKEDVTPKEEMERLFKVRRSAIPSRDPGAGRPTKRDRRKIDKLHNI
ncbi:MAG: RNA-binding S4 domain-containing protein [Candidatus Omnitrophota bacterium]